MYRTSVVALAGLIAISAVAQTPVAFYSSAQRKYSQEWADEAGTAKRNGLIMTGTATSLLGVAIGVKTQAEPPLAAPGAFGGGLRMNAEANTLHRLLYDKNSATYFGYDLTIQSGNAKEGYRVAFQPLSNSREMMNDFASGVALKSPPIAKYPPPQLLHIGETIALDLMVTADGRQRIVDYLNFNEPPPDGPPAPHSTTPSRDYTLDDDRPNFVGTLFAQTAVFINGERFSGRTGFAEGKGGTYWVAIPNHGRYILSLMPHAGFVRMGEIRENAISVNDGDKHFEVRLAQPIVKPGDVWNLYGAHDPFFEPLPAQSDAVIVGIGRLERLLPKP